MSSFIYLMCDTCKFYWQLAWENDRQMVDRIKLSNLCICCGSRKIVKA